ncbi:MAG: hypothetical protein SVU32_08195 [Candidatus Nanohaloarchaea archaeon]|nr:hypothetical protein [Candidatus Nanohaloarchaea archaeon]
MSIYHPLKGRGRLLFYGSAFAVGIGAYLLFPDRPRYSLGLLTAFWILLLLPILFIRTEAVYKTTKEPDTVIEETVAEDGLLVRQLEQQGMDLVSHDQRHLSFETYPTRIHRLLGRQKRIELDIETEENSIHTTQTVNGMDVAEIETTVEQDEDITHIHETGRLLQRVSLLQFLMMSIQKSQITGFLDAEDYTVTSFNIRPALSSPDGD